MSFQLSAQAITTHTAITRMSVSRCSILPPQRGSLTASKWPTSRSIAMLRSPTFGEEDHPWLGNSPASGISCVAPAGAVAADRGRLRRGRLSLEAGSRVLIHVGARLQPGFGFDLEAD